MWTKLHILTEFFLFLSFPAAIFCQTVWVLWVMKLTYVSCAATSNSSDWRAILHRSRFEKCKECAARWHDVKAERKLGWRICSDPSLSTERRRLFVLDETLNFCHFQKSSEDVISKRPAPDSRLEPDACLHRKVDSPTNRPLHAKCCSLFQSVIRLQWEVVCLPSPTDPRSLGHLPRKFWNVILLLPFCVRTFAAEWWDVLGSWSTDPCRCVGSSDVYEPQKSNLKQGNF